MGDLDPEAVRRARCVLAPYVGWGARMDKVWAELLDILGLKPADATDGDDLAAAAGRVWLVLREEVDMPYAARIRDFTEEDVIAGKLAAADREADERNDAWIRRIVAAARGPA